MYEKFTDRARKVMRLANEEARSKNHESIGSKDVLVGLMKEGGGVAANVLKYLDVDLSQIRPEVEKLGRSEPNTTTCELPQSAETKQIVEYSMEEARHLNHNYVGTEHLLLGLLRVEGGAAAHALVGLGLRLKAVRSEVLNLLGCCIEETEQDS